MLVKEGQGLATDSSADSQIEMFLAGSYAAGGQTGVCSYSLDTGTGEVVRVGGVRGVPYPAYLAQSPDGQWIYAVSETTRAGHPVFGVSDGQTNDAGAVWSLRAGAAGLRIGESRPSGGELPTHLTVHPSGRWLVVSNYGCDPEAGSVAVFQLRESGALGDLTALAPHHGSGPVAVRQTCAHVHSTVFTPSGSVLVAADLGADALVVYRFDDAAGALDRLRSCATPLGWGPRYMAWAPDGATLFVVGELACEIAAFAYDAATNSLELAARASTVDSSSHEGVLPSDLHLSTNHSLLYVANRGSINSIATFEYTAARSIALVDETPSYGLWPRDFAISPNGRAMVIANQQSNDITVIGIGGDGRPTQRLFAIEHDAPSYIGFRP
jgi:6-phosphogluconolactonase